MLKEVYEFRALSCEEIDSVAGGAIGNNLRINKSFQLTTFDLVVAAALVKNNTAQAEADAHAFGFDTFAATFTDTKTDFFSSSATSNSVSATA